MIDENKTTINNADESITTEILEEDITVVDESDIDWSKL